MLVLQRKEGQRVIIGHNVCIEVIQVGQGRCRLGITAPCGVEIWREELWLDMARKAADASCEGKREPLPELEQACA